MNYEKQYSIDVKTDNRATSQLSHPSLFVRKLLMLIYRVAFVEKQWRNE